jgi:tetratricopeptide (TPR) repeat protein
VRPDDRASDPGAARLRALERAWRLDPPAVYLQLAEAYRRAGRPGEAEAIVRRGLAETPGDPAGLALRARLLLERERLDEARRVLGDLLGLFPDHWSGLGLLADLEGRCGRRAEEADVLSRMQTLLPGGAPSAEVVRGGDARPHMPTQRRPVVAGGTAPSAPAPSEPPSDLSPRDLSPQITMPTAAPMGERPAWPGPDVGEPIEDAPPPQAGLPSALLQAAGDDPFVNATMAELLAAQGDAEGARRMFAELVKRDPERQSLRARHKELGGAEADLPPPTTEGGPGAARLEQALRDLIGGDR